MFFVHPQIKTTSGNIKAVLRGFFREPDMVSLEKKLSLMFPGKKIIFTDMARSAFRIIAEKLDLRNKEVVFPAYICDIFYPLIKEYSIRPVFLDINLDTFHINLDKLSERISPDTKAILVSHTYGLPADREKIKKSNLLVIEDCAHSFGASYQDGSYTGNLGDVSFFSLYKKFPCFRGGMLVYPKDWVIKDLPGTSFNLRDFVSFLNSFSLFAFLFKRFGSQVAPKFIRKEKMAKPALLNAVSLSFFQQFSKDYEKNIPHRAEAANFFQKEIEDLGFKIQKTGNNVFCYLSALVPEDLTHKRDELVERMRAEGVFCTRIWHTPIVLNPHVQHDFHIDLNDFPNTVEAAKRVINFPLQDYYVKKDMDKMIIAIKRALKDINGK